MALLSSNIHSFVIRAALLVRSNKVPS